MVWVDDGRRMLERVIKVVLEYMVLERQYPRQVGPARQERAIDTIREWRRQAKYDDLPLYSLVQLRQALEMCDNGLCFEELCACESADTSD